MNHPCLFVKTTIAIFLSVSFGIGQERADPLARFIAEIEKLGTTGVAPFKERTAKYIDELKVLEKTIAAKGDLDKVLQVRKEREAWETDKPTPSIDPKNETFDVGLRKLRFYFDKDIATIASESAAEEELTRKKLNDGLLKLEKELTKTGNIEKAVEVNKARKGLAEARIKPSEQPIVKEAETTLPTTWKWGSGGKLQLLPEGLATHTAWKTKGTWKKVSEKLIELTNPDGNLMKITLRADGIGDVVSTRGGRKTTITPQETP